MTTLVFVCHQRLTKPLPPPVPSDDTSTRSTGIVEATNAASDCIATLSRIVGAGRPDGMVDITAADSTEASEWRGLPRDPKGAARLFVSMRSSRSVDFRSPLLNPLDIHIDRQTRNQFSAAYREAIERIETLRKLRMAVARDQVVDLHTQGAFEQIPGSLQNVWQLKGKPSGTPTDGWHVHVDQAGNHFQVRWEDLTWTTALSQTADFLEGQADAMVIQFFQRVGALQPSERDLLLTYAIGDGLQRLGQMASADPQEYLRIRRALFGR